MVTPTLAARTTPPPKSTLPTLKMLPLRVATGSTLDPLLLTNSEPIGLVEVPTDAKLTLLVERTVKVGEVVLSGLMMVPNVMLPPETWAAVPTSETVTPVKLIGSAGFAVIVAPRSRFDPDGTTNVKEPRLAARVISAYVFRVISPPLVVMETPWPPLMPPSVISPELVKVVPIDENAPPPVLISSPMLISPVAVLIVPSELIVTAPPLVVIVPPVVLVKALS